MKIELTNIKTNSKLPKRAKPMDAGADVYSLGNYNLEPNVTVKIPLGYGIKIPNGYVGFVFPRSNLAEKGIICQLPPIDASYTGPIHAIVTNCGRDSYYINEGDRIGQLLIFPCAVPDFVTEPLEERGENGFGSTGK